jgi:AcrR family transcriptional regulator
VTVEAPHLRTIPPEGGKGDRTRRRLLEIAVERFAAEGFRRTSVSEIARAADLTPAAAYAYFAGKESLFVAAVDHDASGLVEHARSVMREPGHAANQMVRVLLLLMDRLPEYPLARRVLAGQEPEAIGRLLDLPSLAEFRRELEHGLRRAQARREIRDDLDPASLAAGLETLVIALLMAQIQTGVAPGTDRALGIATVLEAALGRPR